jgi:tetratricopeptide (TPR) repeat protein
MQGLAALFAASLAAVPGLLFQAGAGPKDAGYIPPSSCVPCHREVYETYRRTGMGRSFYRLTPENTVEDFAGNNTYYHDASGEYYTMSQRGGRYYQRRHQLGRDGRETNIVEKEIHFVLGSGNHARTYLNKTSSGQLVELPLGWYAEKGGFWAMNPGYDRADHMEFRRKLDQECFFCHNAYPEISPGDGRELVLRGAIPEGIDCQRCHGPGRDHVHSARRGGSQETVRKTIVNPARLAPERQLELCLQCHLESTSRRLPYSLRRYGRGLFSFRPGEPLENYILHFDHAPSAGYDDKFEIAQAAYRFLKSACFLKSNGALTCTTCHNPHEVTRGDEALRRYAKVCQSCHANAHNASENCVECHMPKRRTEDVVHVVATDHYIQRHRPARDLVAPLQEVHDTAQTGYHGEVVPLYPRLPAASGENELYLATAQVAEGANLKAGIARLQKAIETYRPAQAEFYVELANAYSKTGQSANAIPYYEEALRRRPSFPAAQRNYAAALISSGRVAAAVKALEAAGSEDAATLNALGAAYLEQSRLDQAVAALGRALRIDPDLTEAYVNLGTALSRKGDRGQAADAFRAAIRVSPGSSAAHNNLASLLNAQGDFEQAQYHFRMAIRSDPSYAVAHYNYGRALSERKMLGEAESELEAALRLDPRLAEAAVSLGLLLAQREELGRAIELYRTVIQLRPDLTAARFNLGLALLRQGRHSEAKPYFQRIIQSDSNDYQAHLYLGKILLVEGNRDLARIHLKKAVESPRQDVRTAALDALRAVHLPNRLTP